MTLEPALSLAHLEPWLEIVLLLVGAVPFARLLGTRSVGRVARRHPLAAALLAGVTGVAPVALLWSAVAAPTALRLSTAVAVVIALLACVRARPAYGTRRGLPPGSLGLAASLDAITNEAFYAQAARRWGPIFKMSQFHRPVVCVADLEQGFGFLRTEAAALEQVPRPWAAVIPGGYVEFMNGSQHEHYREILRRALNGTVITASRDSVAILIRQGLMAMASGGPHDPDPFLAQLATASLLRVFFGVAPDAPEATALRRHLAAIARRLDFHWRIPRQLEIDVERAATVVRDLARREPAAPSVLSELVRTSPDAPGDPTVIRNLVFMVHNASRSVAGTLRWLVKLSADHPRWGGELRREHAVGGDAVATQFVNELVRLWQSEYVYRRTLRPCSLGRFRIPPGWMVRVCVREAHGRAEVFPDPDTFDPGRFAGRSYGKQDYAPFSDGPHACFGAALTVTVARLFLHELAAGFDLRVVADGPVERADNHWEHWRPSRTLRVALTPVAP